VKKKRGWEEEGNEVVLYFASDQDLIPKLFHEWRGRKHGRGGGIIPPNGSFKSIDAVMIRLMM
jgi:hypothetical protein